ncbi:DUF397 domain-containing protein [Actinomadura scrupuli]|uniref:DUF397 domain-containing protein n=1 Tax=Actinomadura scrupuli TaxID=559629 RepID=UPI003D98BB36
MSTPEPSQLAWRKSRRSSEQGGTCVEVAATWHTSDPGGEQAGACAEPSTGRRTPPGARPNGATGTRRAAPPRHHGRDGEHDEVRPEIISGLAERLILVRDSKNPEGAVLSFTQAAWSAFADDLEHGRYDFV